MRGTISTGLDLMAKGLTPFVVERLRNALGEDWLKRNSVVQSITSADPADWDAHVVLVLMWDHWNHVFRYDLTFVERCLVSELREYRNRWAHQRNFSERDTYRCLDGIERLLDAVGSSVGPQVDELRRESLHRLHDDELVAADSSSRDWFTAGVTTVCGVVLSAAILLFFPKAFAVPLTVLLLLVFGRMVYRMMRPTFVITTGPRQCFECSRVFYGDVCPYCERVDTAGQSSKQMPPAELDMQPAQSEAN